MERKLVQFQYPQPMADVSTGTEFGLHPNTEEFDSPICYQNYAPVAKLDMATVF